LAREQLGLLITDASDHFNGLDLSVLNLREIQLDFDRIFDSIHVVLGETAGELE
jgi:hypothetical protein